MSDPARDAASPVALYKLDQIDHLKIDVLTEGFIVLAEPKDIEMPIQSFAVRDVGELCALVSDLLDPLPHAALDGRDEWEKGPGEFYELEPEPIPKRPMRFVPKKEIRGVLPCPRRCQKTGQHCDLRLGHPEACSWDEDEAS